MARAQHGEFNAKEFGGTVRASALRRVLLC